MKVPTMRIVMKSRLKNSDCSAVINGFFGGAGYTNPGGGSGGAGIDGPACGT